MVAPVLADQQEFTRDAVRRTYKKEIDDWDGCRERTRRCLHDFMMLMITNVSDGAVKRVILIVGPFRESCFYHFPSKSYNEQ